MMDRQVVIFELADEQYGVDIAAVESIIKMQPITKVPHAPVFVEGITNLRGKVLPVIDLRKRLGLVCQEATKDSRIVVVSLDGIEVGMTVDGVSEVLSIQDEAIEPPPAMVTTVDASFITGIAKLNGQEEEDRLVILLDLGRVLSVQDKEELSSLPT